MNKIIIIAAILGFLAISSIQGDGNESGSSKITSKVAEGVKSAANKGAQGVSSLTDGITVKVERFTNPPAHQPQQHNIAVSTVQGVGRLIRNVTVESGRFVGSVASAGYRLGTRIPAAAYNSVREAAARIATPRRLSQARSVPPSPATGDESSGSKPQDAATDENAEAPEELKKAD